MLTVDDAEAMLAEIANLSLAALPFAAALVACAPIEATLRSELFAAVRQRAEREGVRCEASSLCVDATRMHEAEQDPFQDRYAASWIEARRATLNAAGVLPWVDEARRFVISVQRRLIASRTR